MQLLEVKNDTAKIIYNPEENHLLPADFLLIEDINQKLITQIVNIEAADDTYNNLATLRLSLSIDREDNLSCYNGYIPSRNSKILYINSEEILELIKGNTSNIYFGNLSNHPECFVNSPVSFVDDKVYIQSDREDKTKIIVQNLITELCGKNKKVILLDFNGLYNNFTDVIRFKISDNMRLPLNEEAFNTILEYDTNDCPIQDKAFIQSIFLEIREYLSTLDDHFVPFTAFKTVVDNEFLSNPIPGLMLLRNKLWLYAQNKIFAEDKIQFDVLDETLEEKDIVIIEASNVEEKWYKFIIQTILSLVKNNCYFILSLNDVFLDKKSIVNLYNKQNIIPVVSTGYDYEQRQILQSVCKNQILCKSSKTISDEEPYRFLVNKMNNAEFVLYGESTLYLPLILEAVPFDVDTAESVIQNEIKRDVDKFLSSPRKLISIAPSISVENKTAIDDVFDEIPDVVDSEPEDNSNTDNKEQEQEQERGKEQEQTEPEVQKPLNEENTVKEIYIEQEDNDENFTDEDLDFLEETFSESPQESVITNQEDKQAPEEEENSENQNNYELFKPVKNEVNVEKVSEVINDLFDDEDDFIIEPDLEETPLEDIQIIEPNQNYRIENDDCELPSVEDNIDNITDNNQNHEENESENKEFSVIEPDTIKPDIIEPDIIESDTKTGINTIEKLPDIERINENIENNIKPENDSSVQITEENTEEKVEKNIEPENITIPAIPAPEEIAQTAAPAENVTISKSDEDIEIKTEETPLNNPDIESNVQEDDNNTAELSRAEIQTIEKPEEKEVQNEAENNTSEIVQNEQEEGNKEIPPASDDDSDTTSIDDIIDDIKSKIEENAQKTVEESESSDKLKVDIISDDEPQTENNKEDSQEQSPEEEQEEQAQEEQEPPELKDEINDNNVKVLPVYDAPDSGEMTIDNIPFKIGDKVFHPKHGKGIIEGFANYSNKILFCQIEFENVGRRILDPRIAGIEKIS